MPKLTIDGRTIEAAEGTTLLEAAEQCSIAIPTLCALPGYPAEASCLVCLVKEERSGRFLPACAARPEEGMVISTQTAEVRQARSEVLDLLAAEHVGDCEAPCRRGCPASIDIDAVLENIRLEESAAAARALFARNPFPAILGRICPAPCEKVCRRKSHDEAVSIKMLERYIGDVSKDYLPERAFATGKSIAVIGGGPAGMSAAFYLLLNGHSVTVLEKEDRAGGELARKIEDDMLPPEILDQEMMRIASLGAELLFATAVKNKEEFEKIRGQYNAVVIASGILNDEARRAFSVAFTNDGIAVDHETYETTQSGVFAVGSVVKPVALAARAVSEGRAAAYAIHNFLLTGKASRERKLFDSHVSGLTKEELSIFSENASAQPRVVNKTGAFSKKEARAEAERCFSCGCLKRDACAFRLAVSGNLTKRRIHLATRPVITRISTHPTIVFEPGKCIKCGRCVRITEAKKERLGLTFIGRGFDVTVAVPFADDLSQALTHTAGECVEACPTAALAFKNKTQRRAPSRQGTGGQ